MIAQVELLEHAVHRAAAFVGGGVGQPQFGRIAQRLIDGQVVMHDIVLGNQPDSAAQRRILGVHVVSLETHPTARGCYRSTDQFRQRRLTGAGRADDRRQRARTRGERHIAQQFPPLLQRQPERIHVQTIDVDPGLNAHAGPAPARLTRHPMAPVVSGVNDVLGVVAVAHRCTPVCRFRWCGKHIRPLGRQHAGRRARSSAARSEKTRDPAA